MSDLATAYVQIIPTAEGIQGSIGNLLGDEADSAGKSGGKKFGGSFVDFAKAMIAKGKGGMATAALGMAKTAAAGIGNAMVSAGKAFAGGVVNMTTQAVSSYAEFEQLVGGVETLFGAGGQTLTQYANSVGKSVSEIGGEYYRLEAAQGKVMANAANAYRTAGLSANEYMETVTSFAASLVSSLDGDTFAAAQAADMAITDMADNANKMGTSMESIQNAYQGFAKQNYTMLDNLKLGYGGTKEEMKQLLEDAQKISGIEYDISSYADIVDAIHVIQTEMGITGTTAKEAGSTIQGSLGMLKSSWQNLVTGLADPNADLGVLIGNMVESAKTMLSNLIPAVTQALTGIGSAIEQLAPIIAEELPGLVEQVLPSLITAATALINGVVAALPTIILVLAEQAPMIINTIVTGLIENLPAIISAAVQLIGALVIGLIQAIPRIVAALPQILAAIVNGLAQGAAQLILVGINLITGLAQGMLNKIGSVTAAVSNIWNAIKTGISAKVSQALNWGRDLISNFVSGIKQKFSALTEGIGSIAGWISSHLHFSEPDEGPLKNFHTWAPDMMMLYAKGIRDNIGLVTGAVDEVTAATMGSFRGLNGEIAVRAANGPYTPAGVSGGTNINVPAINIYTQQGQDPYAIAEHVGYVLGLQVRQKGAVYA